MEQKCIDTIDTQTAPLPSWGQWAQAGVMKVKADIRMLWTLPSIWNKRLHHRHQMRNLSEDTLRDIGISRHDMDARANKPFWKG